MKKLSGKRLVIPLVFVKNYIFGERDAETSINQANQNDVYHHHTSADLIECYRQNRVARPIRYIV